MRISHFLLPICLTGFALGANPSDLKMNDRFTISPTCNGRDLDGLLAESVVMIKNAITALTALLGNIRAPNDELQGWIRAAQACWAIPKPEWYQQELAPVDKNRLRMVRRNFEMLLDVLDDLDYTTPSDNFMYCHSTDLRLTNMADEVFDDAPKGQSIKDYIGPRLPDGASKEWVWVDPNNHHHRILEGDGPSKLFFPDGYAGGQLCGSPSSMDALTYYKIPKKIFLCPNAWAKFRPSNSQNRQDKGRKLYYEWQNMPGLLIHELLHWLALMPSEFHIGDRNVWHPKEDRLVAAYGYVGAFLLSGHRARTDPRNNWPPDFTLTNADSYNVFATMAYSPLALFAPDDTASGLEFGF
ncbi:hypothetical protein HYALB_00012497 [Hymenoscyphus albidus]|uniref:Lysine-specific metallo-endopeptidase domain-containing protein n=1 Tax=Hymenoscyphus albidus TaxID=595503 RepID=A0A9N9Q3W9_9HELO|nr:hypothetical protein HYALB_00012497 [Hymenoscyphus albidus]